MPTNRVRYVSQTPGAKILSTGGWRYDGNFNDGESGRVWQIIPASAGSRVDGMHDEDIPANQDVCVESFGKPVQVPISGPVLAGEPIAKASETHFKRRTSGAEKFTGIALTDASDALGNVLIRYGEDFTS